MIRKILAQPVWHEWLKGLNGHTKIAFSSSSKMTYDEIRMILSGTTTTAQGGSSSSGYLARNLDGGSLGLAYEDAGFDTFPLGDSAGTLTTDPKGYPSAPSASALSSLHLSTVLCVAEGIGEYARNEFVALSDASAGMVDILGEKAVLAGCIGLRSADLKKMADSGASLAWSSRSDLYLYGDTARITTFANAGGNIALGTYWTATGSSTMLRELKAAWDYNETYLGRRFSPKQIVDMATYNPAKAFNVEDQIGSIATGLLADLVLFDTRGRSGYFAVIGAEPSDVALVLRGGETLYGNAAFVTAMPDYATADDWSGFDIGTNGKLVALPREIGRSLTAVQTEMSAYYPLPLTDATPDGEPAIAPSRSGYPAASGDSDGDGILDALDNAPGVFNPVRPVDGGGSI